MKYNITSYIEDSVDRFPDKIAIVEKDGDISFKDLKNKAQLVASFIITKELFNSPVAIYLPKSINAVTCFLAVSYSGNFYVPMDVKSPVSRLESILSALNSDIIITDREHLPGLSDLNGLSIVVLEDIFDGAVVDRGAIDNVLGRVIDTDPVYSIFTSGSTGSPKGVVISHKSVIDYIDWAIETFDVSYKEVIGNQAPFYFDNSVLDIYLMYATGATLVIVPESFYIFPAKLVDFLNEYGVNFIFWVPFVLINIANFNILESKPLRYLEKVLFAGEVMPNKHLNYWRKYLPQCLYANLYGPTEITVDCTCYIVDRCFDDDEVLPIGYACRNSDIIILNEDNKRSKRGERGELCVRGSSLALGYYGNWEKTRDAFVQNPLNEFFPERIYRTGDMVYVNERGEIIFVGRKDFQIKHNGYRIELGEVENAAFATQLMKNVCAVYDDMRKRIVLFYENEFEIDVSKLRLNMLKYVPKYMIPARFLRVEKMPLNANGKIDRWALRRAVGN